MRPSASLWLSSLVAVACRCPNPAATAESTSPESCSAASVATAEAAGATATGASSSPGETPAGDGDAASSGATASGSGETASAPAAATGEPLPEVRVRNVGMHIGGGPNDAATKAPFQSAIAAHFDEFRQCYTLVTSPGKGGVFGVDLRIPREGGRAAVQSARTAMTGTPFRDCVVDVFSTVEFARPPQGPTVISYSLEFSVGED